MHHGGANRKRTDRSGQLLVFPWENESNGAGLERTERRRKRSCPGATERSGGGAGLSGRRGGAARGGTVNRSGRGSVPQATERVGPARVFRAGPRSDQGGGRWTGADDAGVFPREANRPEPSFQRRRGSVFPRRQWRPRLSDTKRRFPRSGPRPRVSVSLHRGGQIEWPRVAPR